MENLTGQSRIDKELPATYSHRAMELGPALLDLNIDATIRVGEGLVWLQRWLGAQGDLEAHPSGRPPQPDIQVQKR